MTRDGSVERIGDQRVLRFERRLQHPVERVWDAITEPDQMPRLFEIAGDPHARRSSWPGRAHASWAARRSSAR
jgi:uncharacterized protein YndB with AHSA1/START domain